MSQNFTTTGERKHPHYLRGTIYCAACGERLVYTKHTGRHGGQYEYYNCGKKRQGTRFCTSRNIRLEKIEDGIADYYQSLQLADDEVARLRLVVRGELADQTADAHDHAERAHRLLAQLTDERAKLLRAHYDDAVPADLLKSEMERITRAMAAAERDVAFARAELTDIENLLEQALKIAGSCWLHYAAAPPFVRRQMNQGFFEKLWIGLDGSVERAELTAPFAALQARTITPATPVNTKGHGPVTERGPMGTHNERLVELRGLEPLTL